MEQYSAADGHRDPKPRRRRFSIWTVLAPLGAIVFIVLVLQSVNDSCLRKGDCKKSKSDSAETGKPANDFKSKTKAKVQKGQSMGSIAAKYRLTIAELQACNHLIDAQTLQPGQLLNVAAIDCEGQDLAKVGANPDPLADDTAAAAAGAAKAEKAAVNNGTAAADPSAKDDADAAAAKKAASKTDATANAGTN